MPLENETVIPFKEARSGFPGRKRVALQTLHRWRLHGVRGVKLETVLIGGLRCTSREAISRFISNQNRVEQCTPSITPKQKQKQAETTDHLLEEAGL